MDYKTVRFGEYHWHPLLEFGEDDDSHPFRFGIPKAQRLIAAVEELGAERFLEVLRDFASGEVTQ